eukprot:1127709-Amphidinium_carterae.1
MNPTVTSVITLPVMLHSLGGRGRSVLAGSCHGWMTVSDHDRTGNLAFLTGHFLVWFQNRQTKGHFCIVGSNMYIFNAITHSSQLINISALYGCYKKSGFIKNHEVYHDGSHERDLQASYRAAVLNSNTHNKKGPDLDRVAKFAK